MYQKRKSEVEIVMDSLKPPIRHAMRTDPDLMHKAFSLEVRIAMAEIQGKDEELRKLLLEYSTLSTEVKNKVNGV